MCAQWQKGSEIKKDRPGVTMDGSTGNVYVLDSNPTRPGVAAHGAAATVAVQWSTSPWTYGKNPDRVGTHLAA